MSGTRWRLVATPLVAVAAMLGVGGLTGLVVYGDWLRPLVAVVAASAAVVVLARLTTGRPFLPTAAGALAGSWLLVVAYVPRADGGTTWFPTPETLDGLRLVAEQAVWYAQSTVAPAEVEPALAAVITAAVLAVFLLGDALAVGAGLAASSGFLLFSPWLPALALERRIPTAALAGAIAAWIALIALSRRNERAAWRARAREGAATPAPVAIVAATAVTMLVALVVTPLAIGGPGWGEIPRLTLPASLGGTSRLDLEIDLRDSLTRQSGAPVLTYASTGGRVDVLRGYTFGEFDGSRWERDPEGSTRAAVGVLWPEQPVDVELDDADTVTVVVGDLAETRILVPAVPRTLTGGSEWRYDASTDEVILDRAGGTAGLTYTLRAASGFHSPTLLRDAEAAIDAGGDGSLPPQYLDLDPRIDVSRIRDVAQSLTAGTATRYDAALALQEYLRGPSFTYSTEVAPARGDAVSAFLADGRGYCVQFATAMVVMARTLDIPARMAIGYLGGAESGTSFVVRGRDAHAWPEVYFPGHGWVRFEPTPAVQTGQRPAYAMPDAGAQPPVPDNRPTARPTADPAQPAPSAAPTPTTEPVATTQDATTPWIAVLAAAGLPLAAAVAAVWWWRRRTAATVKDAEEAWALMRRGIGEGAGDDALTPAQAERMILDGNPGLTPETAAALAALRAALEDHRYAPGGTAVPAEHLSGWARDVVAGVDEAQRMARSTR